jgi:hypothetical protein
MNEKLTPLQKKLFNFARTADQLNTELRTHRYANATEDERALIAASSELRSYFSIMARKAEGVASRLGVVARKPEKTA